MLLYGAETYLASIKQVRFVSGNFLRWFRRKKSRHGHIKILTCFEPHFGYHIVIRLGSFAGYGINNRTQITTDVTDAVAYPFFTELSMMGFVVIDEVLE